MSLGIVKWFDSQRGYGFITWQNGGMDLFVDHRQISTNAGGTAKLNGGQTVEFEVGRGTHGPCANNVRRPVSLH